jgi:hypothetical protein
MNATETEPILRKFFRIELTNGNDGRGSKWFRTAAVRQRIARTLFDERRTPFDHPVKIRITRILGANQKLWDADSVGRGNAKELIDSLVELGWFHDDGPRWITHCDYRQDAKSRASGPAVMVEVWAEGDPCELCDGMGGYAIVGSTEPVQICPRCKGSGVSR